MDFEYDVEERKKRSRTRYNFDLIRAGASLHVADDAERCRVMAAFKYWSRKRNNPGAYATSSKVGAEDPKGPGFRVWFKSTKADAARLAASMDGPHEAI